MSLRTPRYRLHKPSGRAVVTLNGRDIYLGHFQSPDSKDAYDRLICQWLAAGRKRSGTSYEASVGEVMLAFLQYAQQYYAAGSREYQQFIYSLRPLRELHAHTPVTRFGPKALKEVQQRMVQLGWCRNVINRRIGRIKTMFRWAESDELVPPSTWNNLRSVRGIPKGTFGVKESPPPRPAFWEDVEKILPFCTAPVSAMLQLQCLTGMRSGEVRSIRTLDVEMTRPDCWHYRPGSDAGLAGRHKNAWRGQQRVVPLGPKAIEIIKHWLKPKSPGEYLFQPRQAVLDSLAARTKWRSIKIKRSNSKAPKKRAPGEQYSAMSYPRAVARACQKTQISFNPYSLRHGRRMTVSKAFGDEAARCVLGQRSIQSTQHYGILDQERASEVLAKIG